MANRQDVELGDPCVCYVNSCVSIQMFLEIIHRSTGSLKWSLGAKATELWFEILYLSAPIIYQDA